MDNWKIFCLLIILILPQVMANTEKPVHWIDETPAKETIDYWYLNKGNFFSIEKQVQITNYEDLIGHMFSDMYSIYYPIDYVSKLRAFAGDSMFNIVDFAVDPRIVYEMKNMLGMQSDKQEETLYLYESHKAGDIRNKGELKTQDFSFNYEITNSTNTENQIENYFLMPLEAYIGKGIPFGAYIEKNQVTFNGAYNLSEKAKEQANVQTENADLGFLARDFATVNMLNENPQLESKQAIENALYGESGFARYLDTGLEIITISFYKSQTQEYYELLRKKYEKKPIIETIYVTESGYKQEVKIMPDDFDYCLEQIRKQIKDGQILDTSNNSTMEYYTECLIEKGSVNE